MRNAEELRKKALASVSRAISCASQLEEALRARGNCGNGAAPPNGGPGTAYAHALRCRLEIQYALLVLQKGLSADLSPAASPRGIPLPALVERLKSDLSRAHSLISSGSIEESGKALMASDAWAAKVISALRRSFSSRAEGHRSG